MRYFTSMILLLQFSFHLSQHWHPYLFVCITCHLSSFMDFLALYHIVLYRAKFTPSSTSNITTSHSTNTIRNGIEISCTN